MLSACLAGVLLMLAPFSGARAAEPAFRGVDVARGSRVGIVALLSPEVTNVHLGLTVFGTYDRRFANDWHLDQRAIDLTRRLLEEAGYQAVDIALPAPQMDAIRDEDDQTRLNYSGLTRGWTQTYQDILDKNQLEALVVLREEKRAVAGGHGPSYHGYGIVSVNGRIPDVASLFVSTTADVIGGRPVHRSIGVCYGAAPLEPSLIHVDNFADITLADLEPIRPKLEELLDKRIRFELASAGLLHEAVPCIVPNFPRPPFAPRKK